MGNAMTQEQYEEAVAEVETKVDKLIAERETLLRLNCELRHDCAEYKQRKEECESRLDEFEKRFYSLEKKLDIELSTNSV